MDDDGLYDDALGSAPLISWATLATLGLAQPADPTTGVPVNTIGLRVTDSFGNASVATTTVRVFENRPVASFTIDATPTRCAVDVTFDASASHFERLDRPIAAYQWDFGDGVTLTTADPVVRHAYSTFGARTVTLTVADGREPARTDTTTRIVDVSLGNHRPVAVLGDNLVEIEAGQGLTLDGGLSLEPDAACGDSIVAYRWDLDNDGAFDDATGPNPALSWEFIATFVTPSAFGHVSPIQLQVEDSFGVRDMAPGRLLVHPSSPPTIAIIDGDDLIELSEAIVPLAGASASVFALRGEDLDSQQTLSFSLAVPAATSAACSGATLYDPLDPVAASLLHIEIADQISSPGAPPDGASLATARLEVKAGPNSAGTWCFRVTADDGLGGRASRDVTLRVDQTNSKPQLNPIATADAIVVDESSTPFPLTPAHDYAIQASDLDMRQTLAFALAPANSTDPQCSGGVVYDPNNLAHWGVLRVSIPTQTAAPGDPPDSPSSAVGVLRIQPGPNAAAGEATKDWCFRVRAVDNEGGQDDRTIRLTVREPDLPPRVVNLTVARTNSPVDFAPVVVSVGSGEQLRAVPLPGVDSVTIQFSEDVVVAAGQLTVRNDAGHAVPLTPGGFLYDETSRSATWTFVPVIDPTRLYFELPADGPAAIFDRTGRRLDGEWLNPASLSAPSGDTYPSGDGADGGAFVFHVTVLPTDANHDNRVNASDLAAWRSNYGLTVNGGPSTGDFSGDGLVTGGDYTLWADSYLVDLTGDGGSASGATDGLPAPISAAVETALKGATSAAATSQRFRHEAAVDAYYSLLARPAPAFESNADAEPRDRQSERTRLMTARNIAARRAWESAVERLVSKHDD